jgi:hypothetical protein
MKQAASKSCCFLLGSYFMDIRYPSPEVKWLGHDADHSLLMFRMCGAIHPVSHISFTYWGLLAEMKLQQQII